VLQLRECAQGAFDMDLPLVRSVVGAVLISSEAHMIFSEGPMLSPISHGESVPYYDRKEGHVTTEEERKDACTYKKVIYSTLRLGVQRRQWESGEHSLGGGGAPPEQQLRVAVSRRWAGGGGRARGWGRARGGDPGGGRRGGWEGDMVAGIRCGWCQP